MLNVYTLGLVASLLVYFAVGSYAGRKVKHLEDYFVAGRQAPTLLIVGSLVASFLSTNAFLGETGQAYGGHPNVILGMTSINLFGYVLGALYFGRFLRRSNALTVAEYFGRRFASQRVQSVAGISIILGLTGYLVIVTQGTATIVHAVTGLPFQATLLMTWFGYTWFTFYSGSKGVVITDTIMFVLFTSVAILGLYFIVDGAGGWFAVIEKLANFAAKPDIIAWHSRVGADADWETTADAVAYAVILGLAWGTVVAVSPWQASRYLLARDEHTVVRSGAITAAVLMLIYIVLMYAGASINLYKTDIEPEQESMIWAAMNVMPTLVGVLLMSGIMAAGLSSASTFLSLVSFSVSHDVFADEGHDEQQQLRFSRYAMVGVSVAALVIASLTPEGKLFWITYFVGTLYASAWGPVAVMSVWSRRITESAAFWGIIVGLLGNALTRLALMMGWIDLPMFLHPLVIGAIASYATIEWCISRSEVTTQEHEFRESLHQVPAQEADNARQNRTRLVSFAVIFSGAAIAIGMVFGYALPYAAATGSGGGGEMLLALAMGFFVLLTGIIAWRGSERSYRPL